MSDVHATVAARVIALAAEQSGVDPASITPATHFVNDLNFDSLDMVEFTMALEDEFELSVPDDDAPGLLTVGQVIDYVIAHLPEGYTPKSPSTAP